MSTLKKTAALFLALLMVSMLFSGCKEKPAEKVTGIYEREILSGITGDINVNDELPGLSEGICLLPENDPFDPELIDVKMAGLFSEAELRTLYVKLPTERMYPASLTKCMTALLTLESGLDPDTPVTVGEEILEGLTDSSSMAGLVSGCTYTVRDLLYGLMIPSGNDAANALAYFIGGSIPAFVEKMNEKALDLGMVNTHFMNPHGLHDPAHYTTVYDLYLLVHALLAYPQIRSYAGSSEASITEVRPDGSSFTKTFKSTNSFLRRYTMPPEGISVQWSKTGYTEEAGRCLILAVTDEAKKSYIAIIGGAADYDTLYLKMNELLSIIGQSSGTAEQ